MSNWRTITRDDLAARISEAELLAYADLQGFGDPVQYLIDQTADEVRGHIAANRAAVLDETSRSLPPMLIGPACDLAAFAVCKRLGTGVSEPRLRAYEDAKNLLAKIASGEITPEPGEASGSEGVAPRVSPSIAVKPAIL